MTREPTVYPYRWVILAVFMAITVVVEIQWLAHAAVARPAEVFYEGQFDPSSFLNIDFLAMVYMLVFLIMSFPASYVIDTYGIRAGISIGAALIGVSGLAKGLFAENFTAVVIAQIGLAIAQPFILNAVTAVSVRWFPLRERGMAAGLSALAQYIGIVIAMLVTPAMVGSDPAKPGYGSGFESMLMIYGWLTFAAAIVTLVLLRERPPSPPGEDTLERHSFAKGIVHILKLRDMQITLLLFFVGLGIFNAVSSMTDSIAENAGVQDSDGLIGGLMLIGGILGASTLPILSDKLRKRKAFLVLCVAGMAWITYRVPYQEVGMRDLPKLDTREVIIDVDLEQNFDMAMSAPVLPAETTASALPSRTAWMARHMLDFQRPWRRAWLGLASMAMATSVWTTSDRSARWG